MNQITSNLDYNELDNSIKRCKECGEYLDTSTFEVFMLCSSCVIKILTTPIKQ